MQTIIPPNLKSDKSIINDIMIYDQQGVQLQSHLLSIVILIVGWNIEYEMESLLNTMD